MFDGAEAPDQLLPGRASVFVTLRVVDEIGLVETPVGLGVRGARLRHKHGNARILAGQNFFAFEIAAVGDDGYRDFIPRLSRR